MKSTTVLLVLTLSQQCLATSRSGPSLEDQVKSPAKVRALLEKRDTCSNGATCIIGSCCGYDSCAYNCCGIDITGEAVGCGIGATCDYASESVFIGCCSNFLGGCTGTPTMITMSTIYGDVTATDEPTTTTTTTTTLRPTTTTEEPEETTETTTTTRTPIQTVTLSGDDAETETKTATTEESTTTARPTFSADDNDEESSSGDSTASDDQTSVPSLTIGDTTETDGANAVNPGMWFMAGLGAMLVV
ncbi:hypothetical protein BJX64DRAFT_294282 [Aspergillus heterothallicus]